jgi:hypothetical protein
MTSSFLLFQVGLHFSVFFPPPLIFYFASRTPMLLDTVAWLQLKVFIYLWHIRHLFNQPIGPIENIVRVVGADGQEVPFLGYVTIDVSFPENDVGIRGTLTTLALVVPTNSYNQRVLVIIGTNLVKQCRNCFFICLETSIPIRLVRGSISKTTTDSLGTEVKSTSRHPTTIYIASHETKILMGFPNTYGTAILNPSYCGNQYGIWSCK